MDFFWFSCRYESLDENRMRVNVQRQFHHIQEGYNTHSVHISVSSIYSPGRRSELIHPTKATSDSPYSITGLPPDMQVIDPNLRPVTVCLL